jgi:hypothetical protein
MGIWAKELQKKMTAENETENRRNGEEKNQDTRIKNQEKDAWMHE